LLSNQILFNFKHNTTMALVKFNQPNSLFPYRGLLNEMLNDFSNFSGFDSRTSVPAVNVHENQDAYQLDVAAPGLQKEHFSVNVDGRTLTISAENKHENTQEEDGKWSRREFSYSSFARSFTLPEAVKADAIVAKYENGILSVTVPKAEEVKPKTIQIQ
jgi:HSP20 family protein